MGAIGVFIALLALAGFWWWRIRTARENAARIAQAAMAARKPSPRQTLATKAGDSILAGVSDPGTAAAVLMYSLAAQKGRVGAEDEEQIDRLLETICQMNARDRTEAIAFASWAAGHVQDPDAIMLRFLPLWMETLDEPQRQELIGMCKEVVSFEGPATDAQRHAVRRLGEALFPK